MNDVAEQIEVWLLLQPSWVSTEEICTRFNLHERQLRSIGDSPGLCSSFAISSQAGFRHVRLASREEYLSFRHRIRRHAASEFRRTRALDRARHNAIAKLTGYRVERDSGQLVFA